MEEYKHEKIQEKKCEGRKGNGKSKRDRGRNSKRREERVIE